VFWLGLVTAVVVAVPPLRVLVGSFGALMTLGIGAALVKLHRDTPRGGGGVWVGADGLHVAGRLAIARAAMRRADLTRDARGPTVSILCASGVTAVIDVADEAEGQALARGLGLDATQALSSFDFDSPLATALPRWAPVLYVGLAVLLALLPLTLHARPAFAKDLGLALALTWYLPLIAGALSAHLSIGLDGLLVRWAWRRRLIRFDELRDVEHDGSKLTLALASGERVLLSVAWRTLRQQDAYGAFSSRAAYLDAIVARIREAMTASGPQTASPQAVLLRHDRQVEAWVRALRATLSRGARSFRDAELVPEQLWATLEDGSAAEAERAAAAVALGPSLSEGDRARLRNVARVLVSPRLRIAIEAAAEGEDGALREALAALEPAGPRARLRR
jgi:hypothetical protein